MYIRNNIIKIISGQVPDETNYKSPKLSRSRDFKHYKERVSFTVWEKRSVAPIAVGLHEIKQHIAHLTPNTKKVLEYILHMRSRGLSNFTSQEYIAKNIGCSRRTVNRAIQTLWSLKLIDVYNRNMTSNIMKPAEILMQKHVCEELMQYLPIMRSFFLMFCLITPLVNYPRIYFWASKAYNDTRVSVLNLKRTINLLEVTQNREFCMKDEAKKDTSFLEGYKNIQKRVEHSPKSSFKPVNRLVVAADKLYEQNLERQCLLEEDRKKPLSDEKSAIIAANFAKLGIRK